jgi:putative Mg2+ transporter-C (MgtC) family protein
VHPLTVAAGLAAAHGQGWRQVGELLLGFALSSLVGLERQIRGKSAGLRTQSIVGTTSALIVLVSKYGFADVLASNQVILDPSRVAAQIVSGIGFLGAGLILTRQGAVRGLTTAAAVRETPAIGMAAGAGLPLLAGLVTALHFIAVFGFTPLSRRLPGTRTTATRLRVTYLDGRGVLRQVITAGTSAGWSVEQLTTAPVRADDGSEGPPTVSVTVGLSGSGRHDALLARLADVDGVLGVELLSDEELD